MTTKQASHSEVTKVADYLYEVTFYDYDETKMMEAADYLEKHAKNVQIPPGGCSSVHVDDYYGRNLDLGYSENSDIIIHVPAAPGRYASIGVALIVDETWTPEYIEAGMSEADFTALPFCTMDGINEKGVGINANYIPAHDLKKRTTGTNPGKMNLPMSFITRYVLDHAASAKEAVKLLSECNIIGNVFSYLPSELHFMICDPADTYIVEFVDGEMIAVRDDVMTNFYRSVPFFTLHGVGIERYNILKAYKDYVKSLNDMDLLMQQVHYTKMYDPENFPRWYSEVHDDADLNKSLEEKEVELNRLSDEAKTTTRKPFNAIWQTTHSTLYDLKNLTMRIHVQEDYKHSYEYHL